MALSPFRASVLLASMALAHTPVQADDYLWLTTVAQGPISGKLVTWLEVQQRFSANTDVTILRPAIGVQLNPGVQLLAGYQYQLNDRETGPSVKENRLWQQALVRLAGKPGKATIISRTRLEQRFVVGQSDDAMRLRQFLRAQVWLNDRWSAIGSGEVFIGLESTEWGQPSGLEQTRASVGFGHALGPRLTLEGGYMNQRLVRPGADRVNQVVNLSIFYHIG